MKTIINQKVSAFTLLLLSLIPGLAMAELPTLGDPTLEHISGKQEALLGRAFYTSLRENLTFVDDLQINHYLNTLGKQMVSHSDAAGDHFKFFMIASNTINAFAGPNGHIGINSGLVLETTNESQLAGVIAHEISHVSQRHLARAYSQSGTYSAASFATLLAAILLSTQDPVAGQAALLAGIAGAQQTSINFTRQNEYEADRIGIDLLARSGISPHGMVGFFEILLSKGDGLNIEYLRTHPLNSNRVGEAKNRLKESHLNLKSNSDDYRFCKARLQVLTSSNPNLYIREDKSSDLVNLYRKSIALIRTQQFKKAIKALKPLTQKDNHPWLKLALAEALAFDNQIKAASTLLKDLFQYYPDYPPVTLAYADILNLSNQPKQSIALLLKQLRTDDSAIIYKALAQAYFANGQISAALEATGDQYERQGYRELAIQQYSNALKQPQLNDSTRQRLIEKKSVLLPKKAEKEFVTE